MSSAGAATRRVVARLFSAGKPEQDIGQLSDIPARIGSRQLLWIDIERGDEALAGVLDRLDLAAASDRLATTDGSPGVVRVDDLVVLTVFGLRLKDDRPSMEPARVDVLAKGNVVVTVTEGETAGLRDLVESLQGSSEVGALTASTFAAILIDGLIGAFFGATEDVERDIDRLDDRALRAPPGAAFVEELTALRRRIAILRRTLSPHRGVITALAQPDLLTPAAEDPWPAVLDRLASAIDAVQNARELLLGSFDLAMTRTAQRTNDIVRVLTVVSVTLLPAGVIAGIFGMNFQSPFFEGTGLLPAVGLIVVVSLAILLVSRWRGWL
jgi:Mg2+ and Co2+ transporter CorA